MASGSLRYIKLLRLRRRLLRLLKLPKLLRLLRLLDLLRLLGCCRDAGGHAGVAQAGRQQMELLGYWCC